MREVCCTWPSSHLSLLTVAAAAWLTLLACVPVQFTTKHPCACSVEEFWGLRADAEWDQYNAELDGQIFTTTKYEEAVDSFKGAEKVIRSHILKAKVNPFPKPVRKMLGVEDFVVTVHANWYKLLFEQKDAMVLTVQPPVFSDRIKIRGEQWAERIDDRNCNLCTRMEISCRVPGPGLATQIEKGTEKGMKGAYADQPRRVVTYLALRAASGRAYPDPFVDAAKAAAEAPPPSTEPLSPSLAMPAPPKPAAAATAPPPPFSSPLTTIAPVAPRNNPTPPTGQPGGGGIPGGIAGSMARVGVGGSAQLLSLRTSVESARSVLLTAESELLDAMRAHEARLDAEIASLNAEVDAARREAAAERSSAASLRQQLEVTQAHLREEQLHSQQLATALATAMSQLTESSHASGLSAGAAAHATLAAAISEERQRSRVSGGSSSQEQRATPASGGDGLELPQIGLVREETELMGDMGDILDGAAEEGALRESASAPASPRASAPPAMSAPPPPPPPPKQPPPPPKQPPPSPLDGLLRSVSGGEFGDETLAAHVGLGNSLLLVTAQRLLYIRKGTWELLWQVRSRQG